MTLKLVRTKNSAQSKPKRSTPPARRAATGARKFLTRGEVEKLIASAAKVGRYGYRDALAIELAFRHGLRAAELVALEWAHFMFDEGTLYVRRVKSGTPSVHFLEGGELRRLRRLRREQETSRFVFTSERGGPLTTRAFHKIVARAGELAGIGFPVHPHQLRHARGFALANSGKDTRSIQAYLGHASIQSTTIYTALAPDRFRGFSD